MSVDLVCLVNGVDLGSAGAQLLFPDWRVPQSAAGKIGTGQLPLGGAPGVDADIDNAYYIELYLHDTSSNRITARLFCGFVSARETTQEPGTTEKNWSLDTQDANVLLDALVVDAATALALVIPAGTFAAQVGALLAYFQTGLATRGIADDQVANLTGTTVLPAQPFAGVSLRTALGTLFASARAVKPALRPLYMIAPDPQLPGGIGAAFGSPELWIWDGAAPPSPARKYSTTPDGTHNPILPQTAFKRRIETPQLVTRRQAIDAQGLVYTSTQTAAIARYPNPFDPNGAWGAAAYRDTQHARPTANATAHATVSGGAVTAVVVDLNGTGYTAAPTVLFGGPGTGAAGVANMGGYLLALALLTPGANYVAAPDVIIGAPGGGGTQATASATVQGGIVTALTLINPGSGYLSIPSVTLTVPGTGAAATASVASGAVTGFTVTAPGSGYDALRPWQVLLTGGGGSGASAAMQISRGSVVSTAITAAGTGYTSAPTVTVSAPPPGGAQAAVTATVSGGHVTALTITTPGAGYTSAPTLTFAGGGGTGAAGTTTIATGTLMGLTLLAGGTGYTSAPAVSFQAGTGATATAQIGGQVRSVTVTAGGTGYSTPPTVTFADAIQQALDDQVQRTATGRESLAIVVDVPSLAGEYVAVTLDTEAGIVDTVYLVNECIPDFTTYGPDHPIYTLNLGARRLRLGDTDDDTFYAAPVGGVRLNPPANFAQSSAFQSSVGNTLVTYTFDPPRPPPGVSLARYDLHVLVDSRWYVTQYPGSSPGAIQNAVNPGSTLQAYLVAFGDDGSESFPTPILGPFTAASAWNPDPPTALHVAVYADHGIVVGLTPGGTDHGPQSLYELRVVGGGQEYTFDYVNGGPPYQYVVQPLTRGVTYTIDAIAISAPGNWRGTVHSTPALVVPFGVPTPKPPPTTGGVAVDRQFEGWEADDPALLSLDTADFYRSGASWDFAPAPSDSATLTADAQTVTAGAWYGYGLAWAGWDTDDGDGTTAELDYSWYDISGALLETDAIPLTPIPYNSLFVDDDGEELLDDDGLTLGDLGGWTTLEDQMQAPTLAKTLVTALLITMGGAVGSVVVDFYTPPAVATVTAGITPGAVDVPKLSLGTSSSQPIIIKDLSDDSEQAALFASGADNLIIEGMNSGRTAILIRTYGGATQFLLDDTNGIFLAPPAGKNVQMTTSSGGLVYIVGNAQVTGILQADSYKSGDGTVGATADYALDGGGTLHVKDGLVVGYTP